MSAANQYRLFSEALFRRMEADGFHRRSQTTTQRKQEAGVSQLLLYTNKLRGADAIRQTYILRQTFPQIDRVLYYLVNESFSSRWSTGRVWLSTLMPDAAKTSGLPNATPNGYTHYLTDAVDVSALAEEVYDRVQTYAYPFLAAYPTPQAVLTAIEARRPQFRTWAVHGNDLFQLACYLSLRDKETALSFCARRMSEAQSGGPRTSITPEITARASALLCTPGGPLLPPPAAKRK